MGEVMDKLQREIAETEEQAAKAKHMVTGETDLSEKLLRAKEKALEVKVVMDTLGMEPESKKHTHEHEGAGQTAQKSEEKFNVDLGAIFQSQSSITNNALNKLADISQRQPNAPTEDRYLNHIEHELQEIKAARQNAPDPLESLFQSQERLEVLADNMKKHLGLSTQTNVQPSDLPAMIEMEKIRIEAADRQRNHEQGMMLQQRQWQKEDRRWLAQFRLDKMKFEDERQMKSKASNALEDLASAVIEGLEIEEGGATKTIKALPKGRKPKVFKCQECGAKVRVTSPDDTEAECEECGAVYDLTQNISE